MDEYIKKSEAVDVIVKYPYRLAGKTATAIKMIEDLPSADVVPKSEVEISQHLLKDAWKRIEELDELCGELQRKYDLAVSERAANVKGFIEELEKAKADLDLLKSTVTHKEEEAYNKGYTDAKTSILMDIKAIMEFIILDYKEIGAFDNAEIVGYVRDHLLTELEKRYTEGEDER